jgi:hypothetical protein
MPRSVPKCARGARPDKPGGGATVIEAAHTNALGARGMGQKASDFSAVPLCRGHHREYPDSYHRLGEPEFVRQHRIDVQHVATELKHSFDRHFAGLPRV